ncbi:MAG: redoxin domain-containing protein [Thiotrichales bacterium]|nr:redoxin domain-containing protein [Thiotrichales bacterium]
MKNTETKPTFWKKPWVKNVLTVLVFVAAYLTLRPFMQGDVIHGQVPPIELKSISGETFDLSNIQEPTLIHIWATWCPICGVTQGSVESVANDYKVINIATQSGDDQALFDYAKENEMNAAIIVNDFNGKLMSLFGSKAVPADFIIAPGGEIQFVEVGFTSELGLRLRLWWAGLSSSPETEAVAQ